MDQTPSTQEGFDRRKSSDPTKHEPNQAKKPAQVADSWEDDIASSGSSDTDAPCPTDGKIGATSTRPTARQASSVDQGPMTDPALSQPSEGLYGPPSHSGRDGSDATKRPEKSTAAVRRMLAGSLGLKIRPSEEAKDFEKAQLANERKKREDGKRRVEEEKEARRSVWED
jgi:hypothetical protein